MGQKALKPLFDEIVDAIHEKDGLADGIAAENFPARIRAISAGAALESIEITAPPNKVSYEVGELFDPTGMSVWASFSDGEGLHINHSDLTFDPAGPLEEDVEAVTVRFSWGDVEASATQAIAVSGTHIYGVEWDWTNSGPTNGARTDNAVGFVDPVPYVAGATDYGSPFDNLMPWAGMVQETRAGGVEVKEPKYWFKWTKTGKKLKLQIADGPVDGFHVDPVNMDRDDGLGELDFSYIGRYHSVEGWKSETNKEQKVGITRNEARTGIHSLGANFWQIDFAQFWYVGMLFLVEFADWNGEKIGRGCSANNSKENNGKTDAMQYHTGTTAANRDTYGFTQYRNIEGWWDNVCDWMDGCYYNSNGLNVVTNPNQFSDNAYGVLVGFPTSGYPSDFAIPTQSGLEWALYPIASSGSTETYVPDKWDCNVTAPCLCHGGDRIKNPDYGPFCVSNKGVSVITIFDGCRLQERPPKTT